MAIRRISEPDVEPVSLDEAKEHLNVEHDEKDDLIESYISAARAYLENWCHIVIAESEWELTLDSFPEEGISLTRFPLISVTSIKYDDEDGAEQTLGTSNYTVDASGAFGWVVPIEDGWPGVISAINAVRVRFMAGWANDSNVSTAPPELKQAIKLLVGHFYDNREAVGPGSLAALPFAVEALASTHRVPVLA